MVGQRQQPFAQGAVQQTRHFLDRLLTVRVQIGTAGAAALSITHTVETVNLCEPEFMKEYIGKPEEKIINLFDPANPVMSGVVQNQDSYMKGKIAQRWYYDRVGPAIEEAEITAAAGFCCCWCCHSQFLLMQRLR